MLTGPPPGTLAPNTARRGQRPKPAEGVAASTGQHPGGPERGPPSSSHSSLAGELNSNPGGYTLIGGKNRTVLRFNGKDSDHRPQVPGGLPHHVTVPVPFSAPRSSFTFHFLTSDVCSRASSPLDRAVNLPMFGEAITTVRLMDACRYPSRVHVVSLVLVCHLSPQTRTLEHKPPTTTASPAPRPEPACGDSSLSTCWARSSK